METDYLDLMVSGSGFGESILIGWWEHGVKNWGLIDCYAPNNGRAMTTWFRNLGIEHLKFLILTHPHLDHVYNVGAILRELHGQIEHIWWWGGIAAETYAAFFAKLAVRSQRWEYRLVTRSLANFFRERRLQAELTGVPTIEEALEVRQLFPRSKAENSVIRLISFSPWTAPLLRFTTTVSRGLEAPIDQFRHGDANAVSLGLVLYFGYAQVILGGDVEAENWSALRNSGKCPDFSPCLVKVSHHGSTTGQIKEMWRQRGFFGDQEPPPVAVITPWRGKLPQKSILKKLKAACQEVYVTGQFHGPRRLFPSYIHFRISNQGQVDVAFKSESVRGLNQ